MALTILKIGRFLKFEKKNLLFKYKSKFEIDRIIYCLISQKNYQYSSTMTFLMDINKVWKFDLFETSYNSFLIF